MELETEEHEEQTGSHEQAELVESMDTAEIPTGTTAEVVTQEPALFAESSD